MILEQLDSSFRAIFRSISAVGMALKGLDSQLFLETLRFLALSKE